MSFKNEVRAARETLRPHYKEQEVSDVLGNNCAWSENHTRRISRLCILIVLSLYVVVK